MGKGLLTLLCLALGLAGGFAAALLVTTDAAAPAAPAPAGTSPGASPEDLARLGRRVDEIAAALSSSSARERAPSAATATDAGDPAGPADGAPGDGGDRLADLEGRVAALEKAARGGIEIPKDLTKVPSRDLFDLAKRLSGMKRDAEALDLLGVLLQRGDLDEKTRTDAEMQTGYSLRTLGRHSEAEARFRETLGRVGEGSETGGWVNFQIGWERLYQKDLSGAAAAMERAAENAQAHVNVRIQGLLRAAQWAHQAGDPVRARNNVDRLLREFPEEVAANPPGIRQQIEALQKELAGK
jgi:hypothetical protein